MRLKRRLSRGVIDSTDQARKWIIQEDFISTYIKLLRIEAKECSFVGLSFGVSVCNKNNKNQSL